MKFLLTQYGLPKLAEQYYYQIVERIKSYASTKKYRYAYILWQILEYQSLGEVKLIISPEINKIQIKYS